MDAPDRTPEGSIREDNFIEVTVDILFLANGLDRYNSRCECPPRRGVAAILLQAFMGLCHELQADLPNSSNLRSRPSSRLPASRLLPRQPASLNPPRES